MPLARQGLTITAQAGLSTPDVCHNHQLIAEGQPSLHALDFLLMPS